MHVHPRGVGGQEWVRQDYAATEISSHLNAQKRHASAHSLQNSFMDANRSHSAAQAWQVLIHSWLNLSANSLFLDISSAATAHTSAQSVVSWMHLLNSLILNELMQALVV